MQPRGMMADPNTRLGQNQAPDPNGFNIGGKAYVARDFYIYEEDFAEADLQAGSTLNGSIEIQADSDFIWQKSAFFADLALAAQTANTRVIPLVTVQLIDTGSGRNLFELAVPIPSVFGIGELPFVLPIPRLFFARSTIQVQVSNFSTATDYGLRLSFIGYKAYPKGF